jgi:transcriptional regulator with XRE-family HTH domain
MANRLGRRGNVRLALQRRLHEVVCDLREARVRHGLRQADVARSIGSSRPAVGRLERGELEDPSVTDLAMYAEAVGLSLSIKLYAGQARLRDAAQIGMMVRFRPLIADAPWQISLEVPVGPPPDARAVDMVLTNGGVRVGLEFISRLRDVQAQIRPLTLKRDAARLTRLILVVAATRANREAAAEAGMVLRDAFPLSRRRLIAPLRRGEDPGADGLLFL